MGLGRSAGCLFRMFSVYAFSRLLHRASIIRSTVCVWAISGLLYKGMATKETLSTRVARPEESQIRLDNALAYLAESHAKIEEQFRRTDTRIAELREESNQREKRMDERIGNLVSAIGEFISRQNGKTSG